MGHLCTSCYASIRYYKVCITSTDVRDHHGRDRMVVGFTTTCAISAYHH